MRKLLVVLALPGLIVSGCSSDAPEEQPADEAPAATSEPTSVTETPAGEDTTSAAPEATTVPAESISAFDVEVGDCVVHPEEEPTMEQASGEPTEFEDVPTVPCEQPHDSEVYLTFDLPDGDYPGEDELLAAAEERCFTEFEGFVGNTYENSVLDIEYFYPTEESWSFGEDREVACLVYHVEGEQLTGSARDSGM